MAYILSLDLLIEEQVGILPIQTTPAHLAIIIIKPVLTLHASSVVSVHQRSKMVNHSQQLVSLPIDLLKLLQLDRSVHLLSINDKTVPAVVETLQVHDEVLWKGVETHHLIGKLVIFADWTVPRVVLSQLFRLGKALEQLLHSQFVLHLAQQTLILTLIRTHSHVHLGRHSQQLRKELHSHTDVPTTSYRVNRSGVVLFDGTDTNGLFLQAESEIRLVCLILGKDFVERVFRSQVDSLHQLLLIHQFLRKSNPREMLSSLFPDSQKLHADLHIHPFRLLIEKDETRSPIHEDRFRWVPKLSQFLIPNICPLHTRVEVLPVKFIGRSIWFDIHLHLMKFSILSHEIPLKKFSLIWSWELQRDREERIEGN